MLQQYRHSGQAIKNSRYKTSSLQAATSSVFIDMSHEFQMRPFWTGLRRSAIKKPQKDRHKRRHLPTGHSGALEGQRDLLRRPSAPGWRGGAFREDLRRVGGVGPLSDVYAQMKEIICLVLLRRTGRLKRPLQKTAPTGDTDTNEEATGIASADHHITGMLCAERRRDAV